MLRFKFKIVCIFVLYLIIQVNYGKTQKNQANVIVYFEEAKCVNNNCCDDYGKLLGGVVCKKGENSKYINEFPDTKHLPGKVLQEKHVQSIAIMDPNVTVDSNVLEGMSALDNFLVGRSSIKAIPDFKFVKDSIGMIKISSSPLTSLEGGNLQNLTRLHTLSFSNNSIHFIDPDVFKGTVNVTVLDLSHNLLTFIPETLLDPMKRLKAFIAGYNNLLHVNNVFTVTRPQTIFLMNNNITDISSALQFNFEKDEIREKERISKCWDDKDYLPFRSLFAIGTLHLGGNSIKETSQSIFSCLRRFPYASSSVLEIRDFKLHENNIKNLNFLLRYLIINRLEVPKNQIEYLTDDDFKYTVGIVYLELWENKIKRIDTETFRPLRPHLQDLDMSWNLITSLNGSMRFLINLRILKLKRNFIKFFATDEFLGLEELTFLKLEHNQIKTIELLRQFHRLQHLEINDNDVESITPDLVSETLQRMHLSDNPFKCNCLLDLLIRRLNASSVRTDIHTICSKHVSAVSVPKTFNSQDLCTYRCTQYENESYIFVDCSSNNLGVVPQFPANNFADVEIHASNLLSTYIVVDESYPDVIEKMNYSTFHIEDKILGISLENNRLESLDTTQLPPNLIQLYLFENKLRRLPDSILENQRNLKQVTLSGNPWKCDCDAIKFKKWLTTKKEKIKDIDNVRCGIIGNEDSRLNGRVIINLTDLELCPTDIALIVLAPSGTLTVIIFCLVSTILYTRYKLNIKVFLYSHGITFVREEDLDHNKIFDAFISFSHNDDEFVTKEIISVIEKRNPNIHLCFHIRDFIPGELITTNITRAVQNSKKTVLILSKNFLESEWCLLEARTAHSQVMEDKVHRIIVIKVGDLPKEMDPLIKAYLVSTTYITWGESTFWNKLLYVLPRHVSGVRTVPDNMEDNETVL